MERSTATIVSVVLMALVAVLFLGGLFNFVLLLPASVVAIVAIAIAVKATRTVLLAGAALCAVLSVAGFVALVLLWGKLDYGLLGYVVVWGPFLAGLCAGALVVSYLLVRLNPTPRT